MGLIESIRPPELVYCEVRSQRQGAVFHWMYALANGDESPEGIGARVVEATKILLQWNLVQGAGLVRNGKSLELVYPQTLTNDSYVAGRLAGWEYGLVDRRDLNAVDARIQHLTAMEQGKVLAEHIPEEAVLPLCQHLNSRSLLDRITLAPCLVAPRVTFRSFELAKSNAWSNARLPDKYMAALDAYGRSQGWEEG